MTDNSRGHTTKQDVGLVEGCDPAFVFIVVADRGEVNYSPSYYCGEPVRLADGDYCGGFQGRISQAETFETGKAARTVRNRMAKYYRDLDCEMKVLRLTRKEMFQSRLK